MSHQNQYSCSIADVQAIIAALQCQHGGCSCRRNGTEKWTVHCPAHDDQHPSLSVTWRDGKVLVHCHAGCTQATVIDALRQRDLWPQGTPTSGSGVSIASATSARPASSADKSNGTGKRQAASESPSSGGVTLVELAAAKKLDPAFLRSLGVTDRKWNGQSAVRIPYFDGDGREMAAQYRIALMGDDRFRWNKGDKPMLYGLRRLKALQRCSVDGGDSKAIVLVEGPSDCWTLWQHDIPAFGIPGAGTFRPEWAAELSGFKVYLWQEPDNGGKALAEAMGAAIPDLFIMTPPAGRKDVSDCHINGDDVPTVVAATMKAATPYSDLLAQATTQEAAEAQQQAAGLLARPDVLVEMVEVCRKIGLVGEARNAKLLYLIVTSRLLERPISVAVKGPSSGGKSFTVETVLELFPERAYYALSGMSEHALAYSQEPLQHRMLVIYEAAGLNSDFASYLIRSLLSEGRIKYETVEKGPDGLQPRLIEREGPTGFITTTTLASLHPENETRLLSLLVKDDPSQTHAVLQGMAVQAEGTHAPQPDLSEWHALQHWLELGGTREVVIPYAGAIAAETDPRAVRLRRDFKMVLNLIGVHAMLHQCHRAKDSQGRIIATMDDYEAVYDLVIDLVSEAVKATVSATVRETVEAVTLLNGPQKTPVSLAKLAAHLNLDKSAASRRVKVAEHDGYLVNEETRKGKAAKLVPGDPLPAEKPILPSPADLRSSNAVIPPINTATLQQSDDGQREVFTI